MIAIKNYYITRFFCFIGLLLLIILEIIPIPITAFLAIYILLFRPYWFKNVVDHIYSSKPILMLPTIFTKTKQ